MSESVLVEGRSGLTQEYQSEIQETEVIFLFACQWSIKASLRNIVSQYFYLARRSFVLMKLDQILRENVVVVCCRGTELVQN